MLVERRKHVRYIPHKNAFAALGREYARVGKIKNIAPGGLSFEYIVGDVPKKDATELDIFLVGNVFHLHNIPCRIIYDIDVHVPHGNNGCVKILTTKRYGLRFRRLNQDDEMQLKIFIENYTAKLL